MKDPKFVSGLFGWFLWFLCAEEPVAKPFVSWSFKHFLPSLFLEICLAAFFHQDSLV
jgi:hypothetical protein